MGVALYHKDDQSSVHSSGDFDFDAAFQDDSNNQAFYTSDDEETEDTDGKYVIDCLMSMF